MGSNCVDSRCRKHGRDFSSYQGQGIISKSRANKNLFMINYLDPHHAVSDLHKSGYTNDFQLVGNDLLWVGENILIRPEGFAILEYHRIQQPKNGAGICDVFAIVALDYNIPGILIRHVTSRKKITAPFSLANKLDELRTQAAINRRTLIGIRN